MPFKECLHLSPPAAKPNARGNPPQQLSWQFHGTEDARMQKKEMNTHQSRAEPPAASMRGHSRCSSPLLEIATLPSHADMVWYVWPWRRRMAFSRPNASSSRFSRPTQRGISLCTHRVWHGVLNLPTERHGTRIAWGDRGSRRRSRLGFGQHMPSRAPSRKATIYTRRGGMVHRTESFLPGGLASHE